MRIFDFLKPKRNVDQPDIKFGRYSDTYKEEEKYGFWDQSVVAFEKKNWQDSFNYFLKYLSNFEEDNVEFSQEENEIQFKIYQGSKIIEGSADKNKIVAQCKIANTKSLHIGYLRKLVEMNFGLKYTRYALDDDNGITMVFETESIDASPFKLYAALKELALGADKQDDVLLDEFDELIPINMGHIEELDGDIKKVKFHFLKEQLNEVVKEINDTALDTLKYPGAISYLLLNKVYVLIYLLNAKGYTADVLEQIHRRFFDDKDATVTVKNQRILIELKKLREREEDDFYQELYQIKSTFGVTSPSSHSRLVGFIEGELKNMHWYETNRHEEVCRAIPGYIVGYCLFSYGLPPPDKDILHLYYLVCYPSYFEGLGFGYQFHKNGSLDKSSIIDYLKGIERNYKPDYPELNPDYRQLDFTNDFLFAKSLLLLLTNLVVQKIN